jgi:methyl-accepting chemotaxis protein
MTNTIDAYTNELQTVANRLKDGTINVAFAAEELQRITDNFVPADQDKLAAATSIEATIADIQTKGDDIATATSKVAAISTQLKDSVAINVDPIAEPPQDVINGGV